MADQVQTVKVTILDKDYQINCAPDEVNALKQSASYLDEKMREIKSRSSIFGLDRIAVMAALNIANDYLNQASRTEAVVDTQAEAIRMLSGKLDQALTKLKGNVER